MSVCQIFHTLQKMICLRHAFWQEICSVRARENSNNKRQQGKGRKTEYFLGNGMKFKISAQRSNLAPSVGNETKIKIPSEIKPPLILQLSKACKKAVLRLHRMWVLKNQFSPCLNYLAHLSGFLRKKKA